MNKDLIYTNDIECDEDFKRWKETAEKFDHEVNPPEGMRLFNYGFDETDDMRNFLYNELSDCIHIIQTDTKGLESMNDNQLELYRYIPTTPLKEGLFYAAHYDCDDNVEGWEEVKKDIKRSLRHILYWLTFEYSTGIDIDKYIDNLEPDQQLLYNIIKDAFNEFDDVTVNLGTELDWWD